VTGFINKRRVELNAETREHLKQWGAKEPVEDPAPAIAVPLIVAAIDEVTAWALVPRLAKGRGSRPVSPKNRCRLGPGDGPMSKQPNGTPGKKPPAPSAKDPCWLDR